MLDASAPTLTLVGGPTVLIEFAGARLLTDPTFDQPGTYTAGPVTLIKEAGPALGPGDIGRVDAVLLSHDQHYDNLDRAGRDFLRNVSLVLTTPAGAGRLNGASVGLAPWQSVDISTPSGTSLHVTATPARHGPVGIEPLSGDVTGFVITAPGDAEGAIYISGDTVWYEGVAEVASRFDVRLAMLFTGAAEPRGRFQMTMDCNDAIAVAHAFPKATIVAVHNHGWKHYTESQEDLAAAFAALGISDRLKLLAPGSPVTVGSN
ncbi:MAG TPA: MBL fold metallo-hydrolase [Bauldia sp.]|nr:MBL fold metallo-hydrolase [Bauldia sp.]